MAIPGGFDEASTRRISDAVRKVEDSEPFRLRPRVGRQPVVNQPEVQFVQVLSVTAVDGRYRGKWEEYDSEDDTIELQPVSTAPAWVTSTVYEAGDFVSHGEYKFRALTNHTSASTDEPDVGVNWATFWSKAGFVWVVFANSQPPVVGASYLARRCGNVDSVAVFRVGDHSGKIMGIMSGTLDAGDAATMRIWEWDGSSMEDTGIDVSVSDWLLNTGEQVFSGTKVTAFWHNGLWWVDAAACEPG